LCDLFSENYIEHCEAGETCSQGGEKHPAGKAIEAYPKCGGEDDVGWIPDIEHHTPRIRSKKFGDKVGAGIDTGITGKIKDKGSESEHDDVVRGEGGKHRNNDIECKKKAPAISSCILQGKAGAVLKKSGDIKKNAHEHHRKEQYEYPNGIQACGSLYSFDYLMVIQHSKEDDQERAKKSPQKIGLQLDIAAQDAEIEIRSFHDERDRNRRREEKKQENGKGNHGDR